MEYDNGETGINFPVTLSDGKGKPVYKYTTKDKTITFPIGNNDGKLTVNIQAGGVSTWTTRLTRGDNGNSEKMNIIATFKFKRTPEEALSFLINE